MTTQGFHRWKEFHPVDINCCHRRKSVKIIIRMISKLKSLYQFSVMQTWVWHDFGAEHSFAGATFVRAHCWISKNVTRLPMFTFCLRLLCLFDLRERDTETCLCEVISKNDSTGEIRKYLRISSSGRNWATLCPHWHPASLHQQS